MRMTFLNMHYRTLLFIHERLRLRNWTHSFLLLLFFSRLPLSLSTAKQNFSDLRFPAGFPWFFSFLNVHYLFCFKTIKTITGIYHCVFSVCLCLVNSSFIWCISEGERLFICIIFVKLFSAVYGLVYYGGYWINLINFIHINHANKM